ncbi:MAG: alpha-galactosidase [bacterium]
MFLNQLQSCASLCASVMVLGMCLFSQAGWSVDVTPPDRKMKDQWVHEHWLKTTPRLPFSFTYDGKSSEEWMAAWPMNSTFEKLDNARTRHTFTWTDPKKALEIRCVAVDYADFPAIEWTVYFKNTGPWDTPLLENIQALDAQFERGPEGEFVLRHWNGDTFNEDLYRPFELPLESGARRRFAPNGGRGSNGAFPYYNLVMPGGGILLAVGWPGQWATAFIRDATNGLRITAGQELTHLTLQPGEQVRSPLIAMVFWQGDDTERAQNLWRKWMWTHNVPRAEGRLPSPFLFGNTSLWFNEMVNATDQDQMYFINRYQEERIKLDFWWMDAGWYPCDNWPQTGTWEPDPQRFPKGLRAVSDHALQQGVKTLVWFEPERVAQGTWIADHHPSWLLGKTLLNLGLPVVRQWLTDHVDRTLSEQGIHFYRQDFNMDPLEFWRKNDRPDRQGITENLHIQNYLAYWDALRERHPDLFIDSCASGGRRNDLETMRRAVALHPTDYNYSNLTVKQAFHASLFQWIPYFASNTLPIDTIDTYAFRSGHAMGVVLGYDMRRKDLDYDRLRQLTEEWRRIAPCYYGDYYPLTPYNIGEDQWIAWQFHRTESGDGVVEAFRRPRCGTAAMTFRLQGLDPDSRYEITNSPGGKPEIQSGKVLMESGLTVEIPDQPGARVLLYKPVKP